MVCTSENGECTCCVFRVKCSTNTSHYSKQRTGQLLSLVIRTKIKSMEEPAASTHQPPGGDAGGRSMAPDDSRDRPPPPRSSLKRAVEGESTGTKDPAGPEIVKLSDDDEARGDHAQLNTQETGPEAAPLTADDEMEAIAERADDGGEAKEQDRRSSNGEGEERTEIMWRKQRRHHLASTQCWKKSTTLSKQRCRH